MALAICSAQDWDVNLARLSDAIEVGFAFLGVLLCVTEIPVT
jgi:hypothetical protein